MERNIEMGAECTLHDHDWATVTEIRLGSERFLYVDPFHDSNWIKQDQALRRPLSPVVTPTLLGTAVSGRQI